jgi:hypothetical protein
MSSAVLDNICAGSQSVISDSTRMPSGFYFEDTQHVLSIFSGMDRSKRAHWMPLLKIHYWLDPLDGAFSAQVQGGVVLFAQSVV